MDLKKTILYTLLPNLLLVPTVLLLMLAPKDGWGEGSYSITGRYVETSSGQHMIYRNTDTGEMRYVFLLPRDDDAMFAPFETGDAIRVRSAPLIRETDSGLHYVEAFAPKKIWDLATIPKLTNDALAHIEILDAEFSQWFS